MNSAVGERTLVQRCALVLGAFVVGLGAVAIPRSAAGEPREPTSSQRGMVVSVSAPGSDVGREILRQGGNAVDAAVATAFAMAVTYPPAGNLGGGGFMMICPGPGKPPVCVEYRETAPAAATPDMLPPSAGSLGHRIVGVPGTVRGLALAHQKYGKLPWKTLVLPAVRLAERGFELDAPLARSLNGLLKDKDSQPFAEMRRVFDPPGDREWETGDLLVQPELAKTLQRIADEGPDAFYRGPIADLLVEEMQQGGGLITKADLAAYRANLREPIHGTYRGYDVYGPPPPSSGGICLIEMLNLLEGFELRTRGRQSPQTMHLITEAMRRAYCDRARHLGDPDFVKIPAKLTSKEYAQSLAAHISLESATKSEALAPDIVLAGEGESTTHFSVIDAAGMAVANTYTLEGSYGSRVVVQGAGFLLNNEMGDFNRRPGYTDRKGAIGTDANLIAPGKRMLSSQTPTLVLREGRVVLVTGSPGGRTIINTVLGVVLNVLEFELEIQQAVDAPRMHHQWFPDELRFEGIKQPEFNETVARLKAMGHQLDPKGTRQGDAHSIWVDAKTGEFHGAADRRISGKAAGL